MTVLGPKRRGFWVPLSLFAFFGFSRVFAVSTEGAWLSFDAEVGRKRFVYNGPKQPMERVDALHG